MNFIPLNYDKSPDIPAITLANSKPTYDDFEHAAVLLPKDIMFVDFDGNNLEEEKYIEWLKQEYPTLWVETGRGIHMYFRRPAGVKLLKVPKRGTLCGLVVDYILGNKAYGTIKLDGVVRKRNREVLDFKDIPVLPKILYPLRNSKSLAALTEGDGRNAAMFYHLRLIKEQYPNQDITDVLDVINNVILNDPLGKKELNTVCNSALKAPPGTSFDVGTSKIIASNSAREIANWLIAKYNIKNYKQRIFYREDKRYINDDIALAGKLMEVRNVTRAQWEEVKFQIKGTNRIKVPDDTRIHIQLDNGLLIDGEFVEIDSPEFTPFYLPISYNPEAYDKHVDKFLDFISCDRKDLRNVLEEMVGHVLMLRDFPRGFFFLVGKKGSGKSTYIEMLREFAGGDKYTSTTDIDNFASPLFIYSMMEKLLNICDDVDDCYIDKAKNIKVISGATTSISARNHHELPINSKPITTLVFTSNKPPIFKDKSAAMMERLFVIPIDSVIEKREFGFMDRLTSANAKSYLLRLALEGIQRFMANNVEISKAKCIIAATSKYQTNNDSILSWLDEYERDLDNVTIGTAYLEYKIYSDGAGIKSLSRPNFVARIEDLGYTSARKQVEGDRRLRFVRTRVAPPNLRK